MCGMDSLLAPIVCQARSSHRVVLNMGESGMAENVSGPLSFGGCCRFCNQSRIFRQSATPSRCSATTHSPWL